MSDASRKPAYDRVRDVAAQDAKAASDAPDEQTAAAERAHDVERKKAKTAAVRAEEAEEKHVAALNRRISVLQTKLDLREDELRELLPRNAELEQARCNASLNGASSLGAVSIGGMLASISSLLSIPLGYVSGGFGAAMLIGGLILSWTTHRFGWPPKGRRLTH